MKKLLLVFLVACGSSGGKQAAPDAAVVAGDVGPVTAPDAKRVGGEVLARVDDVRVLVSSEGLVDLAVEAPGYGAALTTRGVRIAHVPPGSIAQRLGLADGDVIALLGGEPVRRLAELQDAWLTLRRDGALAVTVERGATRTEHHVFFADELLGMYVHDKTTDPVDPIYAALLAALKTGVRVGDPVSQVDPEVLAALATPNILRLDGLTFSLPGRQPANGSPLTALGLTPWDTIQQVGDVTVADFDDDASISNVLGAATGEVAIKLVRVKDPLTLRFQPTPGLVDHDALAAALQAWSDREATRRADRDARNAASAALADDIRAHVTKVDDTHFQVDQAFVDQLMADPLTYSKGARITPSIKNGKPNGFKIYAVRPGSAYDALGLANGDTIHAINGTPLDSVAAVPDLDTLRAATKSTGKLVLGVTRRGREVLLEYTLK